MGDYSRDPVARLVDSAQKHYVGVRLQQGVPVVDADMNLLEDLRKHETYEFVRRFIGDGVPDGNDGFRIEALAGGAIGTMVLQVDSTATQLTRLEVVLVSSTSADRLGFLPGNVLTERFGTVGAQLTCNAAEPFVLADGLTLTVRVNDGAEQTATFAAADFVDISQATALEVQSVLATALVGVTIAIGIGSDFRIIGGDGTAETAGRLLTEGVEALIENDLMFQSQPLYLNTGLADSWSVDEVPSISPVVADRQDVVYLDVWEREIGHEEDEDIVQASIGIETTKRLRREWVVRVAEGAADLSGITRQAGHKYTVLAELQRLLADNSAVTDLSINDMRRTQINIAKYLKTPINVVRGSQVITADDFSDAIEALGNLLLSRYRGRVFPFTYDPLDEAYNESIVRQALEAIIQVSRFSVAQGRAGNYNNVDGLRALTDLYALQTDLVSVVNTFGHFEGEATTQSFIDGYTNLLDDPTTGLAITTSTEDLIGAITAQQAINSWLSLPLGEAPEGTVIVSIDDVQPGTNLTFDIPFNITYEIESRVTSPRAQENFLISVETTTPSPWEFSLNAQEITLDSASGIGTVVLTVTPRVGAVSAEFNLTVVAELNPTLVNMTHTSTTFQIGLPPTAIDILQWISPPLSGTGRIPFTQFMFQLGAGQVTFEIGIRNSSDSSLDQRWEIAHHVVPPPGEEALWLPALAAAATQEIDVAADDTETLVLSITGPNPPAAGTQGSIVIVANLLLENSLPPAAAVNINLEIAFDVSA